MTVNLLTDHHLEFLTLKEAAQARQSLHLSKCDIYVGNHMSRLIYKVLSNQIKGQTICNGYKAETVKVLINL